MNLKEAYKKNEDRRRKDRYGHSVRRFTANDLSFTPDIKITKIIPPTMDDMGKCNMSRNGKLSVLFSVEGENFKLDYNPTICGYDGMSALAREHCSITNLDTGKVYDCTGAYSIPWLDEPEDKYIYHQSKEPVVQAYMNPTEQMVLAQFIKPFAKDYLGVDATESNRRSKKNEGKPDLDDAVSAFIKDANYEHGMDFGPFTCTGELQGSVVDGKPYIELVLWVSAEMDGWSHRDDIRGEFFLSDKPGPRYVPRAAYVVSPGKFYGSVDEVAGEIIDATQSLITAWANGSEKEELQRELDAAKDHIREKIVPEFEHDVSYLYPKYLAFMKKWASDAVDVPATANPNSRPNYTPPQAVEVEIKRGPKKGALLYTAPAKKVAAELGPDLLMTVLANGARRSYVTFGQDPFVNTDHGLEWNTSQAVGFGIQDMLSDLEGGDFENSIVDSASRYPSDVEYLLKGDSGKEYSVDEFRNAAYAVGELIDDSDNPHLLSLIYNNQPWLYDKLGDTVAYEMDHAMDDEDED